MIEELKNHQTTKLAIRSNYSEKNYNALFAFSEVELSNIQFTDLLMIFVISRKFSTSVFLISAFFVVHLIICSVKPNQIKQPINQKLHF